MRRLGVDSVPIALFIAVFTGIVLALLSKYIFTGAVPLYFVGALVGKTIMMELGPVLTGLALAGRVGANIAAELGTMRVTEQVDALETLAYDPARLSRGAARARRHADVPGGHRARHGRRRRSPAGSPRSTCWTSPPLEFVKGLRLFYQFKDIWFGLVKAASFGAAVTLAGCLHGPRHPGRRRGRRPQHHPRGGARLRGDPGAGRVLGAGAAVRSARWSADRPMIRFSDVYKAFGPKEVLDGFTLDIPDGETTVIIGFSGTGKSVALKHIVGLLAPDAGTVRGGRRRWCTSSTATDSTALRRDDRLRLPVRGAVRLDDGRGQHPARPARAGACERRRSSEPGRARAWPWWTCRAPRSGIPAELSGGMRKRVGIARAIALRPRYILYDEPTTGLDPVTSAVIDELMVRTRQELGVTGVVVTHDMRSAYTVGDRIAMLYEGRIRQVGTIEEIRADRRSGGAELHRGAALRSRPAGDRRSRGMKRRNEFLVGLVLLLSLAVVVGGALWLSEADIGRAGVAARARASAPSAASRPARR